MAIMSDKETLRVTDTVIKNFDGNSDILGSAIGALHIGRIMGWRTLYLIHTKSTIRKYEKVLNLTFREVLVEETKYSRKSIAFKAVQKVSNFWKAVKGEIPNIRSQKITKK